jgi:hypothetical protein
MSLVLRGFLPHNEESGEEVADAGAEHGLYLEVGLPRQEGTSVTGSLTAFSYFFRSGFYAHSLAMAAARNASCVTTDT